MAAPGSVAIIGLGARGLSVLERLLALAEQAAGRLRIELIDPVGDGAGVHAPDQPDYLLLNTICSQVSMFPDSLSVGDTVRLTGPSLHEWVVERGLRIGSDGFSVGTSGREIQPWDFLPRRLLGEYLGWFLDRLLDQLPAGVEVRLHRSPATRLDTGGSQLVVELAGGRRLAVDRAFLTTGYTDNIVAEQAGLISRPYPMPAALGRIAAGQTVAIGGFGLSALDAMSCLTVGRGGRYERAGDRLRYLPGGAEPRLLLYSRSGKPCRARPRVLRYGPPYRPLLFTPAGIDRLRAEQGGGALDFDRQVWPLVLDELRVSYRRAQARATGPAAVEALEHRLAEAARAGELLGLLDRLDLERGSFRPDRLLDGTRPMSLTDADDYQGWFAGELAADLVEGEIGLQGSIVKQTLDILRELRDTFRYAVDFGGLTPESNRRFFQHTVPVLNRAVVGPQFERHQELLALLAAGIARVSVGPDPALSWDQSASNWLVESRQLSTPHVERAEWVLAGRSELPAVGSSASPLLTGLFRQGSIRPNPAAEPTLAGIEVDADQHPVGATGEADRRIWVLGPLCEGSTFYNNLVPSPGCYSRPIADAHRCVTELLAGARSLAAV